MFNTDPKSAALKNAMAKRRYNAVYGSADHNHPSIWLEMVVKIRRNKLKILTRDISEQSRSIPDSSPSITSNIRGLSDSYFHYLSFDD